MLLENSLGDSLGIVGPGPWAHPFVGPCWGHSFVGPSWAIHLDNFSKKSSFLVIFHQKLTFVNIFLLKVVFPPRIFAEGMPVRTLVLFIFEKICIFHQIVIIFSKKTNISCQKLLFLLRNWHCLIFSF